MASTLQHHQTTQFFGLQTTSTTDHTTTAKDTCNARRRHDTMTLDSLNLGGIGPRGRSRRGDEQPAGGGERNAGNGERARGPGRGGAASDGSR